MNVELVVFGAVSIAIGLGLLSVSKWLYPRLEFTDETFESVWLLTRLIVVILVLAGLGLVVLGLL